MRGGVGSGVRGAVTGRVGLVVERWNFDVLGGRVVGGCGEK